VRPIERKIYFVRVACGTDDLADLLKEVDGLSFAMMFSYLDGDGGGVYLKSLVDEPDICRLVLARVRMSNLPNIATRGKRLTEVLRIAEDQGLAEETHFVYFRRSKLLAVEYNHFGPRIGTLQGYLIDKINDTRGEPLQLTFQYLLDEDVLKLLSDGAEVRMLQMAVPKAKIGELARHDPNIFAAFKNAAAFGDEDEIEIVLRRKRRSKRTIDAAARNDAILAKARLLATLPEEPFTKLRAKIKPLDDDTFTADLLENKYTIKLELHPSGRSRNIDSDNLFQSIQQAYRDNHDTLMRLSEYEQV
jgi:hypothetical protein